MGAIHYFVCSATLPPFLSWEHPNFLWRNIPPPFQVIVFVPPIRIFHLCGHVTQCWPSWLASCYMCLSKIPVCWKKFVDHVCLFQHVIMNSLLSARLFQRQSYQPPQTEIFMALKAQIIPNAGHWNTPLKCCGNRTSRFLYRYVTFQSFAYISCCIPPTSVRFW